MIKTSIVSKKSVIVSNFSDKIKNIKQTKEANQLDYVGLSLEVHVSHWA